MRAGGWVQGCGILQRQWCWGPEVHSQEADSLAALRGGDMRRALVQRSSQVQIRQLWDGCLDEHQEDTDSHPRETSLVSGS